LVLNHVRSTAVEIDGGEAEGLVHGHQEVAGAQDAALVAERFVEGLAECNPNVFDGVMLVDVEIAPAVEVEIEGSVGARIDRACDRGTGSR